MGIVKIEQMKVEPCTSEQYTQQQQIMQIAEIEDEDAKYCNDFLQFEYHIGGYDMATGIKKDFIGANEQRYVNKHQKQTDEEGMEHFYNNLTLQRFAILASLNSKLRDHSKKLEADVQNASEEIEKLQKELAKIKKRKKRRKK